MNGPIASRSGVLLIDKPAGLTSHDVVARVRRLAGTRKVGHAGTLDPMATGLLVLGLNSSTRLLTYLVGLDKEYTATIRLGQASSTDDAEGELGEPVDASAVDDESIEAGLEALRGTIAQVPSSVSAIKVAGRRAYDIARAGEDVSLPAREVTISAFELLDTRRDGTLDLDVRVECSSGTYIRALARDLGRSLGVGGHLTALRRTRVGPFDLANAASLEDDLGDRMLEPAAVATRLYPRYELDPDRARDLAQGKRVAVDDAPGGRPLAVIAPNGRLAGLAEARGGVLKPLVNFPTDEVLA